LHRSERCWCPTEQIRLKTTSIDSVFIEELEDDEGVEQHFVEEQKMEKEHKGGEHY